MLIINNGNNEVSNEPLVAQTQDLLINFSELIKILFQKYSTLIWLNSCTHQYTHMRPLFRNISIFTALEKIHCETAHDARIQTTIW